MRFDFRLAIAAAIALAFVAAVFGRNPHPHVWWETVPAYGAIFGYAGAWALVWFAKSVLAPRLRRDDDESDA